MTQRPERGMFDLTSLPTWGIEAVVQEACDLVVLLNADYEVSDVSFSGNFNPFALERWLGQRIDELVADDSQDKIEMLLSQNSALVNEGNRWRHLNFLVDGKPDLPLIIKFFRFQTPSEETQFLVARDLRPVAKMQDAWRRQDAERKQERALDRTRFKRQIGTRDQILRSVGDVGAQSLSELTAQATERFEALCVEEALQRCRGDEEQAAEMLSIPLEALRRRLG